MSIRDATRALAQPTADLIAATVPMSDQDLCEDERVVAFINAVSEFAAGTLGLLDAIYDAELQTALHG